MLKERSVIAGLYLVAAVLAAPTLASAGVQDTPDGTRTMVNSDVGDERWAITRHPDGSLTGNVFRQGGGDPAFIVCTPNETPESYTCDGGDGCLTLASEPGQSPRGTSDSPINDVLFANKDVGAERWAITENEDGTVTGNVFRSDGGPPSFIYCEPEGDQFRCLGDEECTEEPCGQTYVDLGVVPLPSDFFDVPSECSDSYTRIGDDVPLRDSFFEPSVPADECLVARVTISAGVDLTGATVRLSYPTSSVELPGSIDAPSVQNRVEFLIDAPFQIINDQDTDPQDGVDDLLNLSLTGLVPFTPGAFADVTFDCLGAPPSAGAFSCEGVGDADSESVPMTCSVSIQ